MIRFGIMPCTQAAPGEDVGAVFDRVVEQAEHAERYGFEACLFSEHHQQPDGYFPSPLIVAAAVAARTERIKVGSAVILLPLYNAVRVAEDAALIDVFSKGRLILGVGMGYEPLDFKPFGVSLRQRRGRLEEGIEVIIKAWTESRFSYHGRYYQLEDVTITPKPVQKPRPPIWIGGLSEAAVERAARFGDAWISTFASPLPLVAGAAAAYRKAAAERGRKARVVLLRELWIASSFEEALAQYEPGALSTHRLYFRLGRYRGDPSLAHVQDPGDLTLMDIAKDRFILGSPVDCIREIERYHQQTGGDFFVVRMSHPAGPAHEKVLEAIKLFGETVIAHFRDREGGSTNDKA